MCHWLLLPYPGGPLLTAANRWAGCGPGTLLSIPVPEQPAPQPQAVAQATLVEP